MELIVALHELKQSLADKSKDQLYKAKLEQFESLLQKFPQADDATLCKLLYNQNKLTSTYTSLKYRMEDKLMNDVLFLLSGQENLKLRNNAVMVNERMLFIATVLMKNFYRKEAISLFEKCFKTAQKYHYTLQAIQSCNVLSNHYGFIELNDNKMMYYMQKNDELVEILKAEIYVRKCNIIMSNMYMKNIGWLSPIQLEKIRPMIGKMQALKAQYKTNFIILLTNDLTFFYYESIGNYEKALEVALQGLKELEEIDNQEVLGIFQSKLNIGSSYFHLKKYDEASTWFKEAISITTNRSRSWLFSNSLLYLNLMSQKKYDELTDLTISVVNSKTLNKYPHFQELWAIREAFIHFLIKSGKIEVTTSQKNAMRSFSLKRFLNSVPMHSKDKSGQNITILVIQILFLLLENKYIIIIDKVDYLKNYTYLYLKQDNTYRSNCFIKMIVQMVRANFNPARTKTYTQSLYKKLANSQLNIGEKNSHVEIIPYDYLWEIIMELLEKDKTNF